MNKQATDENIDLLDYTSTQKTSKNSESNTLKNTTENTLNNMFETEDSVQSFIRKKKLKPFYDIHHLKLEKVILNQN